MGLAEERQQGQMGETLVLLSPEGVRVTLHTGDEVGSQEPLEAAEHVAGESRVRQALGCEQNNL